MAWKIKYFNIVLSDFDIIILNLWIESANRVRYKIQTNLCSHIPNSRPYRHVIEFPCRKILTDWLSVRNSQIVDLIFVGKRTISLPINRYFGKFFWFYQLLCRYSSEKTTKWLQNCSNVDFSSFKKVLKVNYQIASHFGFTRAVQRWASMGLWRFFYPLLSIRKSGLPP